MAAISCWPTGAQLRLSGCAVIWSPTGPSLKQIFDARTLIEPLIARTAAQRRTPADVQAIAAALQAYLDAPDHDASRRADGNLHLAIAKATQNPILVDISVDLRTKISLNLGAEPYTDEVRRIAIRQHQDLVAAVIGGAGRRCRRHRRRPFHPV